MEQDVQCISEQSIFVRNQKNANDLMQEIDPLRPGQLHSDANQRNITCQGSFKQSLPREYKIYESLYNLLQNKRITFLSDRISQSVQAALHKKSANILLHDSHALFNSDSSWNHSADTLYGPCGF